MTPHVLTGLVVGFLVGLPIDGSGSGMAYFGLLGGLGGWVLYLGGRLKTLEATREATASTAPDRQPDRASAEPEVTSSGATPVAQDIAAKETPEAPVPTPESPARPAPQADAREPGQEPGPSPGARILTVAKQWFTTGNAPVKVGVVVVLFGVGFFIKPMAGSPGRWPSASSTVSCTSTKAVIRDSRHAGTSRPFGSWRG